MQLRGEQAWSQIRNCRNQEGEILDDLVREDGIARITQRQSRKRKLLCLFLEKSSKDLQRSDVDVIVVARVVLSGLSEPEEWEAFACDMGNLKVPDHELGVQVVVVVSTTNFRRLILR